MGVSFSDVKESLTTIRQRLVDIRDEVEWLEKYIAELEAAQHSVQRTDCPVCHGRGFNVDWNNNRVQCSTCNGTGISR